MDVGVSLFCLLTMLLRFYLYVEIGDLFDDVFDAYDMAIRGCMIFFRCNVFEKFLVCMF